MKPPPRSSPYLVDLDIDIPDVGILVIDDELYLNASDLVDLGNAKALQAHSYLDGDAYEQWLAFSSEIQSLIESEIN